MAASDGESGTTRPTTPASFPTVAAVTERSTAFLALPLMNANAAPGRLS